MALKPCQKPVDAGGYFAHILRFVKKDLVTQRKGRGEKTDGWSTQFARPRTCR
jgi:hypothetical protein